jgi:acetyl-CoA carboxylase biotin carboxyl carrier protein
MNRKNSKAGNTAFKECLYMIKMLELREMIRLVSQSSIDEFNLTNQGVRISMKKPVPVVSSPVVTEDVQAMIQLGINEAAAALAVTSPDSETAAPVAKEEKEEPKLHQIVSSGIGVFSGSSVKAGDKITADSILCRCVVEALGIVHEIKPDVSGEIVEVLVQDGQLVEYGQPLFLVKHEEGGNK